jgi:inhibitor of cysteine peptidase
MLTLINNPVLLIIGIIGLGFLIIMTTKIVKEFQLNKLLKQKHAQMRIVGTSTHFAKRIGVLTSTTLASILVLLLAFTLSLNIPSPTTGNLLEIRSSQDVLEIYNDFESHMTSYNGVREWFVTTDVIASEADAPAADEQQGSDDYSETNVQVQGIDEMDNVITDGKYIYQMQYNQVLITLAYTQSQESSALSNYKVIDYINEDTFCPSGMYVTGLYVDDNYLVVIGSEYTYYCNPDGDNDGDGLIEPNYYYHWYGYNNNVKVYVYDKNDDFALSGEYDLSGDLIGTRKIDDQIYIITNTWMPLYQDDINVDTYLPYYQINEETTTANYEDIIYVDGTSPNSLTSFFAIDLENETVDMEVILGDSGYNLYVSHNNIYLVGNIYDFSIAIDESNPPLEPVIETLTAIQKISINGADLEYVATGKVPGYTLNQFSMDEKDGYVRIATTTGWWGESINNRVFILDENLEEVSRLENLGKPGETIRSVRFVGDYGYVVTFEQTDPFYVINLKNPNNPYKEGELEIPGFSTYLQPLNDKYMLGIGFGDSEGGTNGLKISVYDISDKTNPVVFDEVIFDYSDFGWSWSSATYNHKDLLVDLNKGIIALPFSTYDWSQENGYNYNSGVLVYNFDEVDGLTKSGFVTHDQDTEEDVYVYKIKFIDDYFYTVSNTYIKASLISDPETIINSVTLPAYQYASNGDDTVVEEEPLE